MKIYKIRDILTGEFSEGCTDPRFTKRGRSWNSIGSLKNHLRHQQYSKECEIVVFEMVERGSGPIASFVGDKYDNKITSIFQSSSSEHISCDCMSCRPG